MGKRARIHGSTLRARPLEEKALTARAMEREVLPLLDAGAVTVPIAEAFPLDRVADAYERFAAGGKLGKIVLTLRATGPRKNIRAQASSAGSGWSSSATGTTSARWIEQSEGPPDSSASSISRSVSGAPHSSQRSPAVSSVCSSRSIRPI